MSGVPLPEVFNGAEKSAEYICVPEYKGPVEFIDARLKLGPGETMEFKEGNRVFVVRNPGPDFIIISPDGRSFTLEGSNELLVISDSGINNNQRFLGVDGFSTNENIESGVVSWQERDRMERERQEREFSQALIDAPRIGTGNVSSSSGVNTQQNPWGLTVLNANTTSSHFLLFDSYVTRTASNFNNRVGIQVICDMPNISYGNMLAQSENQPFLLHSLQITLISGGGWNWFLTRPLMFRRQNRSGAIETKAIWLPVSNDNLNGTTITVDCGGEEINGWTAIEGFLPASTSLSFIFNPMLPSVVAPAQDLNQVEKLLRRYKRMANRGSRRR